MPRDCALHKFVYVLQAVEGLDCLSSNMGISPDREAPFPLPHGRGDEAHHGGPGVDPRSLPKGFKPRDLVDPTLQTDRIRVKTRDFR